MSGIKYIFLGDRHLDWRRGYEVLAMGHLAVSADLMISVEKNSGVNSLVIKHITEHDAGDYVCQVGNFQILENLHLVDKFINISALNIE